MDVKIGDSVSGIAVGDIWVSGIVEKMLERTIVVADGPRRLLMTKDYCAEKGWLLVDEPETATAVKPKLRTRFHYGEPAVEISPPAAFSEEVRAVKI